MTSRFVRRTLAGIALAAAPLVVFAVAAPFANAQPPLPNLPAGGLPPLPGGLPKPGSMAMMPGFSDPLAPLQLVDKPVIQNELDLAEVQLTEIKAMKERQEKEIQKLLADKKKEYEKQLFDKLLPKQQSRLRQIVVQLKKNRSLQDEYVVTEIGLSEDQVKQINDIYEANEKETEKLFQDIFARKVDPTTLREKGRQARTKLEADLMAVMTEEQKKKFSELGGEPFDVNPMDLIAPPMGLDSAIFPPALPPLPDPEGDLDEDLEMEEDEEMEDEDLEDADAPAPRPTFGPAPPPRP
jgi:hypothetical protein